jgi:integrase
MLTVYRRHLAECRAREHQEAATHHRETAPWLSTAKGFCYLKQLDLDRLREFRATWSYSPIAARKRLENLRAFFRFCLQCGWVLTNPAALVKPPRAVPSPTLPFTAEQVAAILEAADRFWDRGFFGRGNRRRIRGLVLLLRYSGLRIMDAVCLEKSHIVGDRLFLYTQKTGTPVRLPLPPDVLKGARGRAELESRLLLLERPEPQDQRGQDLGTHAQPGVRDGQD